MDILHGIPSVCLGSNLDLNEYGLEIIDPGIRKLVGVLHKNGYKTLCSCAGSLSNLEPYPWVTIGFNYHTDRDKVIKLLSLVSRFNVSLSKNGRLPKAMDLWTLVPVETGGYDCLYLHPLDNNRKQRLKRIFEMCKQSEKLAEFIESNI